MKFKINLKNRKAQKWEISDPPMIFMIAVVGTFLIIFILILQSNLSAEAKNTHTFTESTIKTSNILLTSLKNKDKYGTTYSELIETTISSPTTDYHGETVSEYTYDLMCNWFDNYFERKDYKFYLGSSENPIYPCGGSAPPDADVYSEFVLLPIENQKVIEVHLETWKQETS